MTEYLTSAQMRAIERAAIESGAVTGATLMERAGCGAIEVITQTWPSLVPASARVYLLCGPGNNGGDGYVMARVLHTEGWRVTVAQLAPPVPSAPDAVANFDKAKAVGCPVLPISVDLLSRISAQPGPVLVIDALFGTGLGRPLSSDLQAFAQAFERQFAEDPQMHVVAVDLPSGLCADTGQVMSGPDGGAAFRADLTVTFHRRKYGHVMAQGPAHCGLVRVVDIGLGPWDEARHGA